MVAEPAQHIAGAGEQAGAEVRGGRGAEDDLQGKLADKVYASLYISLMHCGGIIVPPGYTDPLKFADGNPYGVSHITGPDNSAPVSDTTTAALHHLAKRVVAIAGRLAG